MACDLVFGVPLSESMLIGPTLLLIDYATTRDSNRIFQMHYEMID